MQLNDATFARLSNWMKEKTGVNLPISKKALMTQRLHKRLTERSVHSFEAYFRLLMKPEEQQERQIAVDLLTTHETYFFREPKHFEWLKQRLQDWPRNQVFHMWSGAASTGEEVWSLAMLLSHTLGGQGDWKLMGSDISEQSLRHARNAHYSMQRSEGIPADYLRRYCLKGTGQYQGTLLINKALREHVTFMNINLDKTLPPMGPFHVIFLRNVLIYFDTETKTKVIERVVSRLGSHGYLVVSHSESLHGVTNSLQLEAPGIYRKTS